MPVKVGSCSQQFPERVLDILKVVKLLHLPVTDAAAADKIIDGVAGAFIDYKIVHAAAKLSSKQAAQLSSCVIEALQCAGWLVAARAANADIHEPGSRLVISTCLLFAWRSLYRVSVGYDFLKAVLRPSADGNVSGGCLQRSNGSSLLACCLTAALGCTPGHGSALSIRACCIQCGALPVNV
jgi:hypothetical protein